jgi:ABC-type antimicrobial peptide transport system permease subunit
VWLRTADDPGTLATVRAALASGDLAVTNLGDRRQQIADIQRDPLQLDIIGTLSLGAGVALLLALIGIWTASWINAQGRLTSFAVLRALGTTPRQILSLLVWEQGVVYITALSLGALLGLLLSAAALPSLVFSSLVASSGNGGGPSIDVPPAQVVLPRDELGIALGALALICGLAIIFTTLAVSRASLGERLRLNQD